jgi:hypothetical protein
MNKPKRKPPWYTAEAFWRTLALIGTLASVAGLVVSLIK